MVQLHTKLRDATPHMENQRTTEKKAMTMAVDNGDDCWQWRWLWLLTTTMTKTIDNDDDYDDDYKAGSFD